MPAPLRRSAAAAAAPPILLHMQVSPNPPPPPPPAADLPPSLLHDHSSSSSSPVQDDDDMLVYPPRWDDSPNHSHSPQLLEEDEDHPPPPPSSSSIAHHHDQIQQQQQQHHHHYSFRSVAIAVRASLRLWFLLGRRIPSGSRRRRRIPLLPLFRVHVHALVAIARLSITLPSIRRRQTLNLLRLRDRTTWPHRPYLHRFRSLAAAVLFCSRLASLLRRTHIRCPPLHHALHIISQASSKFITSEQQQHHNLNSSKCKLLLYILSSISSYLTTAHLILDHLPASSSSSLPALSAFYYALKDLCRCLPLCRQYIHDSFGSISSYHVFAKLESTDTLRYLILDLSRCHQRVLVKFEAFLHTFRGPTCSLFPEFAWDCMPPASPGLFLAHYLSIQARKDLAQVASATVSHSASKSFWDSLWPNRNKANNHLTAAEEEVLSRLLLARLRLNTNHDAAETPEGPPSLDSLNKYLFVDKKYVKALRFLGIGSYGVVEEVVCFGEKYAMKTIKGVNAIENANEAAIQARLHHPNIVRLTWYTSDFESHNSLSLLMDLMDMNLDTFIEQQMLSGRGPLLNFPLVALDIMMQIAKAMAYLHGESIMHRDLKAANVLLNLSGGADGGGGDDYVQVKVADFGLAKSKRLGSNSANTKKVGTRYWRAPEVFYDQMPDTDYSFSADVYSFAMTCYEIITGKKPYADADQIGLKERIAVFHERPSLPPDLHPLLRDLIQRCWHGTPACRPTFDEVCSILEEVKDDLTFGGGAPSHQKSELSTAKASQ